MITKLEIRNNLAMSTKGIHRVVLDPIGVFTLLLGRNGNGKTTLLGEISPLPPDNADYDTDGYKEIVYTYPDKTYRLVSHTGKKSTHYFYVNGENLNKGMTLKTQQELVKLHFGITPEIKGVITGIDRADLFSVLSPARRKALLMTINPSDTTYVLKLYEKIKAAHTNTKGALKHQQARLTSELQRQHAIHHTPIEELRYEASRLDTEIKHALFAHGVLSHVKDPDLQPHLKKMDNILIDLLTTNEEIEQPLSWYEQAIKKKQRMIDEDTLYEATLIAFISNISDKINRVNPDKGMSIDEYENKIELLKETLNQQRAEQNELKQRIERTPFFTSTVYEDTDLINALPGFIERIIDMEITPEEGMSSGVFLRLLEQQKKTLIEVDAYEREWRKAQHTLKHFTQAEQVSCPECQHGFKLGFEKFTEAQLQVMADKLYQRKEQGEQEKVALQHRIAASEPWYYAMLDLMRYVKTTRCAAVLTDMVKQFGVGKQHTPTLITVLSLIVEYHHRKKAIQLTEETLHTTEGRFQLINENDITALYLNLEKLNEELATVQRRLTRNKCSVVRWEKCIDIINADGLLRSAYQEHFDTFFALLVEKGKYTLKEAIEQQIATLSPKRDQLLTDIIRSESLNGVIQSIQEQVEELTQREKHLRYLVDTLSPTKGFIGYLMLDFLRSFCANVNATIGKIWTEPLTLLSPDVEENDLDYKFKVVTTDVNKPITDIRRCSGGEKDVIDFAIRSVLLRYLGKQCGLPFVMDEIGSTFDELHRQAFSHYIATENRIGTLPQTFMVSHYVSQYGAFKPNEVNTVSLAKGGITLPTQTNENVIIG